MTLGEVPNQLIEIHDKNRPLCQKIFCFFIGAILRIFTFLLGLLFLSHSLIRFSDEVNPNGPKEIKRTPVYDPFRGALNP